MNMQGGMCLFPNLDPFVSTDPPTDLTRAYSPHRETDVTRGRSDPRRSQRDLDSGRRNQSTVGPDALSKYNDTVEEPGAMLTGIWLTICLSNRENIHQKLDSPIRKKASDPENQVD